jgi:hypothetical protein
MPCPAHGAIRYGSLESRLTTVSRPRHLKTQLKQPSHSLSMDRLRCPTHKHTRLAVAAHCTGASLGRPHSAYTIHASSPAMPAAFTQAVPFFPEGPQDVYGAGPAAPGGAQAMPAGMHPGGAYAQSMGRAPAQQPSMQQLAALQEQQARQAAVQSGEPGARVPAWGQPDQRAGVQTPNEQQQVRALPNILLCTPWVAV